MVQYLIQKRISPSGFVGSFTPPGLTTSDCNYVDTTTDSRLGGADYNESHVQSWQSVVISNIKPWRIRLGDELFSWKCLYYEFRAC